MKNQYTSENGRVELFTPDIQFNHSIYLDNDIIGAVSFPINTNPMMSFEEGWILDVKDVQLILKTVYEANEDINVKDRHLQTLKNYNLWRRGDDDKSIPTSGEMTSAVEWAIEKIENNDI